MRFKYFRVCIFLCCFMFCCTVVQASENGEYIYTVLGDEVRIDGYIGTGGDIVVPSRLEDRVVTKIGANSFAHCYTLTSVIVPDSVIEIGDAAFADCIRLTSANILGDVKLNEYTFTCCPSLSSVSLNDSVSDIGSKTFYACKNLRNILLPDSVTNIGEWDFYGCENLGNIVIPETVDEIGDGAFFKCSSLNSLVIPRSVKRLGNLAISECPELQQVKFNPPSVIIPRYSLNIPISSKIIGHSDSTISEYCNNYDRDLKVIGTEDGLLSAAYKESKYFYEEDKGGVTIVKVVNNSTTLIIPKELNRMPVTRISRSVFDKPINRLEVESPKFVLEGNSDFIPENVTIICSEDSEVMSYAEKYNRSVRNIATVDREDFLLEISFLAVCLILTILILSRCIESGK